MIGNEKKGGGAEWRMKDSFGIKTNTLQEKVCRQMIKLNRTFVKVIWCSFPGGFETQEFDGNHRESG